MGIGTGSTYGLGIVISAKDMASSVLARFDRGFKKVGNTVDRVGVGITSMIKKINRSIRSIPASLRMAQMAMKRTTRIFEISGSKIQQAFQIAAMGAVLVAPFVVAINKAAELSDAMADVAKTTGLTVSEVKSLRNELLEIDTRSSVEELLSIAEIGGKLGVAQSELLGFTGAVDKLNVALGEDLGGTEAAARGVGIIKGLFKETRELEYADAINKVGSAINYLGSSSRAQERDILNFTQRVGQLGTLAPSVTESLALGAFFSDAAIPAEIASSGLTNIMLSAGKHMDSFSKQLGVTQEELRKMLDTDPGSFVNALAKSFQGLANTEIITVLEGMHITSGEATKVVQSLAGNITGLEKAMADSNEQFMLGTSLVDEFNVKNNNLAATFAKVKKSIEATWVTIGETIEPIVVPIVQAFQNLIEKARAFIQTPIGKFLTKLTAILAGLVAVGMALFATIALIIPALYHMATATWAVIAPLLPLIGIIAAVVAGIVLLVMAYRKISKAIREGNERMANFATVIGMILGPVGQLVVIFSAAKRGIQDFKEAMAGGEIKGGILGFFQKIGGLIMGVMEIWKTWNGTTSTMSVQMKDTLDKMGMLDWVLNIGGGLTYLKDLFGSIRKSFKTLGASITASLKPIRKSLSNLGESLSPLFESFQTLFMAMGLTSDKARGFGSVMEWVANNIGSKINFVVMVLSILFDFIAKAIDMTIGKFQAMVDMVGWVVDRIAFFVGFTKTLGQKLVQLFIEGIRGDWSKLVSFLTTAISALPGGSRIMDFLGVETQVKPASPAQPQPFPSSFAMPGNLDVTRTQEDMKAPGGEMAQLGPIMQQADIAQVQQQSMQTNNTTVRETSEVKSLMVQIQPQAIEVDGREIARTVQEEFELNDQLG